MQYPKLDIARFLSKNDKVSNPARAVATLVLNAEVAVLASSLSVTL